jgi:hypothetical protein
MSEHPVIDAESPIKEGSKSGKGKITEQQKVYMDLIRSLTNKAASIVVGVAVCDCNHKDTCEVYQDAREIAKIIRQLQEVPKGVKGRPRVRT